jgi:predicted permease
MTDLRFASRQLLKNPVFTAVAVLTLALGIGANTAMFSVLNALLLRALPYPNSERLARVYRTSPQSQTWPHSVANFLDHREQNTVFERIAAFSWWSFNLAEPGAPAERLRGMIATADFFPTLGVAAALGRTFTAEEDHPGANNVVVLSYSFWMRRFAGDTNILGRTLRLDGESVSVIGVMPASFEHPLLWGILDAFRPAAFTPEQRRDRGNNWLNALARLKPGVPLGQAQAEMRAIAKRLAQAYPDNNVQDNVRLVPLRTSGMDDTGRHLTWLTMGLAGFVLLIACANLANLQLVRTASKARELAVRAALGAGRVRLMRQLLTESLVVSLLGGSLGLLLAVGADAFIGRRLLIADEPGLNLAPDASVLIFALLCSVLTGIVFGTVPAWIASRADVNDALKESSRGTTSSRSQHRLRHTLIIGEVALALVLLAGASLFVRGLQRFTHRDPGWRVDGLLTGWLSLPGTKYERADQQLAFFQRLEERLAALPGVERAAISSSLPIWAFGSSHTIVVEGRPAPPPGQEPLVYAESVSPGYFDTIGIQLRQGRVFASTDTTNRVDVIVINDAMARRFWPNENPLGKRIASRGQDEPHWQEIVGVVSDVRFPANLGVPDTRLQVYYPFAQEPRRFAAIGLRTTGKPESMASAVRRAVAEIDPDQPVNELDAARKIVDRNLANLGLVGTLLGAFAVLGLVLAGVGTYGVISSFVAQRTGEIGIRMALGALKRDVLWLVLGRGLRLILAGALLGLGGALATARLLAAAIPELPARDPMAMAAITIVLVAVALVACWLPARRAAKVEPMEALRYE